MPINTNNRHRVTPGRLVQAAYGMEIPRKQTAETGARTPTASVALALHALAQQLACATDSFRLLTRPLLRRLLIVPP
jgi:hypothetical protein